MTGLRVRSNDWVLVVVAGLVIFMAQLDTTIVNVALPALGSAFHADAQSIQWVVIAYPIPLVALTLLAGRWLDVTNRRTALIGATVTFAAASLAAAASAGLPWLISARVIQGGAAAVLLALAPVLAVSAVDESAHGRALGVVATLAPLGGMCGPVIGGVLVEHFGWPTIFLVNLPLAAVIVEAARRRLDGHGPTTWPRREWTAEAALVAVACTALLLALTLPLGLHQPAWIALAAIAVPCIVALGRLASFDPVRRTLRTREMRAAHGAFATSYTALFILQFIGPFFLAETLHLSSTALGVVLMALPAATALVGPLSGALSDRHGDRAVATLGAVVATAGLLLLVPLDASWSGLAVAWRLAIVGAGFGLLATPTQAFALDRADPTVVATVSSTTNLARQLGILFGPAVATIAWSVTGYDDSGMRWAVAIAGLASVATVATCRQLTPRAKSAPQPVPTHA